MASLEKRTRNGQLRWYARYRDRGGRQLVKVFDRRVDAERFLTTVEAAKLTDTYVDAKRAGLISRGVSVVAVCRWLRHSNPEIIYRVYADRRPDDEAAGRAAMATTMAKISPAVYPACTREAVGKEKRR